MTTKTFKYGKHYCKAYKKTVGQGYEIGLTYAGHQCFVGNFIHAKEANQWWTIMTYEMKRFHKKYSVAPMASTTWTCKFLSNWMYKCYYSYLDREFTKYHRGYTQAFKKDERRYTHFKKTWTRTHGFHAYRRAA